MLSVESAVLHDTPAKNLVNINGTVFNIPVTTLVVKCIQEGLIK
jgi:hypothetical protein